MTSLPASDENDKPKRREDLDARLRALAEAGFLTLGEGGKPRGLTPRIVLSEGPSLSEMIINERR